MKEIRIYVNKKLVSNYEAKIFRRDKALREVEKFYNEKDINLTLIINRAELKNYSSNWSKCSVGKLYKYERQYEGIRKDFITIEIYSCEKQENKIGA